MFQTLLLFDILQNFFFTAMLIGARKPNNAPMILFFLRNFLSDLLLFILQCLSLEGPYQPFFVIVYDLVALSRPAIMFYFIYSLAGKPMPRAFYLLWILPVLNLVFGSILKNVDPALYNAEFYNNFYINISFLSKILFTVLMISQFKIFSRRNVPTDPHEPHQKIITFYWGKYFLYFHAIANTIALVYIFLMLGNGRLFVIHSNLIGSEHVYNTILTTLSTIFLFIFGYFSLRNPAVFQPKTTDHPLELRLAQIVLPAEEKQFATRPEFDTDQIVQYTEKLNRLMNEEKVYLDSELSLKKLSQLSQIPLRPLSQFINDHFQKTYKEYVNGYRIDHASELLIRNQEPAPTIYAVACDSGFNSESIFYKLFKDYTGLTPKQYQEKHRQGASSPENE